MLEKIKKFYSTKRTQKVVVTVLVMVLLIGGVSFASLYTPTTASKTDSDITGKLKSAKEKLRETAKDISEKAKDKKKAEEDKKKVDEDTAKADEASKEKAKAEASTSETPSTSTAKSGSAGGSTSSGSSTSNTSGKHEHNWVAETAYHEATLSVNHIETTPAVTKDVVYFIYTDGAEIASADTKTQAMHEAAWGPMSHTTVTKTEIITPAHSYVVEDVPFKPGYNETIYKCSCGATK